MPAVDNARYEREEAQEELERCHQALTTMVGADSTAGKLSIERKLNELERKWKNFKLKIFQTYYQKFTH